ncbi:hypothetical protein ACMD2_09523 [Ananas comosus]|uniref:Transposase, Ptta/En/Spm, plant n=1 Tax=Ananas comosus TaxID=4615 RepID=A0A199UDI9_ANACO|nr:hypothetical protein ACMD2_09523 [Ananas comosus]
MTKRKRIRITQSEDEYWKEPQSNSNQQAQIDEHAETSININQEEGDEVDIEDENGQRRRGKTKLADLWNLPRGHRVVVNCNTQGQPVGNEGGLLGQFLGTIARNGGICTLSHKDWRYVKKDAEKDIIAQVKGKFFYPTRCEKWILKSTGRKWKDYKCDLKGAYFDEKASLKELYNLVPKDVIKDQWVYLVDFWKSNEGKARSIRNTRNRAMLETTHTAGTKSFARVAEEMRKNHPQMKQPQRAEIYLSTHKHKDGTFMNDEIAIDLQKKILENSEGSSSRGEIAWEGDPYSQILGKEKRGYVRGIGLGPSTSEIFKARFEGLKMTTFDEITVEREMRQMKEHMERLENQIQEQNNTIIELKCAVQCLATGRAIECGQLVEPSIGRVSEVEECSARNASDSVHHNGSSKCKKSTRRKKIASDASASHL